MRPAPLPYALRHGADLLPHMPRCDATTLNDKINKRWSTL